jgi:hypothetical protein
MVLIAFLEMTILAIGAIFHGFFEVEPDVPKMVEINVASKK